MLGYALFVVPMIVAFLWIKRRHTTRQALLDLLAFNLLFGFDFAALLPNNLELLVIHLLLLAIVALEIPKVLSTGRIRLRRTTLYVFVLLAVFVSWASIALFVNHLHAWGIIRVMNYVARAYVLSALFFVVGIRLAKDGGLYRFVRIMLLASVLVGIVAIIQSASGGRLLSIDVGEYYLGVFQPLGEKAIQRRDLAETTINFLEGVRTIQLGDSSFYRAPGTFDGSYVTQCVLAIVALSFLTSNERTISRWLFVPLVLCIASFVVAINRSAIVAFAFTGAGVMLVQFRSLGQWHVIRRWAIPLALLGLALLVYLEPIESVVAVNLDGLFGARAESQVAAFNGRVSLWTYVLSEIGRNPVWGSSKPITLYRAGWKLDNNPEIDISAHNSFLEVAYRGGILPAFILFLLYGFCLLRTWKLTRRMTLPRPQRMIFLALLGGTAVLFIFNLTSSRMYVPQLGATFWIICGYVSAYGSSPEAVHASLVVQNSDESSKNKDADLPYVSRS